jgi:hypothetical protein
MTCEQLDIAQRTTSLVDQPRCPGDDVRRPECDEQPCRPMLRKTRLNQTTILSGVIGPPRSDRMTGPMPVERPRYAPRRMFWFLQSQAAVGIILALSIMVAAHNPNPNLRMQDLIGLMILSADGPVIRITSSNAALVGEAVADQQLRTFKTDPANRKAVCDVGLWPTGDIGSVIELRDIAAKNRIEDHVPGQVGDLNGPQASLGGQQDDHTVAEGMAGATGKDKEVVNVVAELGSSPH